MSSEIEELIDARIETANVDYKEGFEWVKHNRDMQLGVIKDILAMANTRDGGTIIIGVKDEGYELVGVSNAILESFDQSNIAQMVHRYGKPKVNLQVIRTDVSGKSIIAIRVAEFDDVPIISSETITALNSPKPILRKGALYIRTSAATTEEICSDQEMREVIGRAMVKRGDELLRTVERLIKGQPISPDTQSIDLYQKEIQDTEKWFAEVLQKGFLSSPRWELFAHPTRYLAERIRDLPLTTRLIREAQVSLRGWPFPYIGNRGEASPFNSGFQAYVDWKDIREAFRFYKSGLFVWKQTISEDLRDYKTESGNRTLSFIRAIYSLTEWSLFLVRLYEAIGNIDSVTITIRLIGSKNRQLASFDSSVIFHSEWYESQEDIIEFKRNYTLEELRASGKDIAGAVAKHIFHVFNWTDVTDDTIHFWQNKLTTRTY